MENNPVKIISAAASVILGVASIVSCCLDNGDTGNGKKIFADYHGVRYTRAHDGKLGRWEMYANTEKSTTGRKTLCYNADLVDSEGRHDIAATAYPIVGMQSNLDEDYLEYQILSAKAAGIDGFFIEWGYLPHENDVLLRAMQKVAAKYDFEVGVNWCDGWLYYNWITKIYPEIDTREEKTEYMVKCYQYLVDSVYSVPTAAKVGDLPVFYHFGPGATVDEYKKVLAETVIPKGMKSPVGLRRWADWGHLENDRYIPVTQSDDIDSWKALGEIPTAWLPARVRKMDAEYPYWDNYAIADDLIEFMKPFRDSIWNNGNPGYVIKSGFAMPGMDNSGCAGWGRGHFFKIPRDDGRTYERMWQFCMESKDSLDMMFIASWSDYTEGHEIEPTFENGYRDLKMTLKYASEFKDMKYDDGGLELPLALFGLRKDVEFLSAVLGKAEKNGIAATYTRADVDRLSARLDEAAGCIAGKSYGKAERLLSSVRKNVGSMKYDIEISSCKLDGLDAGENRNPSTDNCLVYSENREIFITDSFAEKLAASHYSCTVSFEYLDEGQEFLFLRSETDKTPEDAYSVTGKIRTDGSGEWKSACIELPVENIVYVKGRPAYRFSGDVAIRNLSMNYVFYSFDKL